MAEKIAYECRYFSGENPCAFHKEHGVKCGDCPYYSPVSEKILIIKMGAKGDVLRTTCILRSLKRKYPDSYITWVVEKGSQELLQNVKIHPHLSPPPSRGRIKERGKRNSYTMNLIDRVMEFSAESVSILETERFDLVLSLDSSVLSASISEMVNAGEKKGFGLNEGGKVYPYNPEAEEWFRMGIFDDVKRRNKKTYQEIIHEICGLGLTKADAAEGAAGEGEIIVSLTDEEKEKAKSFAEEHGVDGSSPVVGLNTGAGRRWELKKWTLESYQGLIEKLHEEGGVKVLLFGGAEEEERNRRLKETSSYPVIDTGSGNTIREFFALLNLCDVVVAGDTLAIHAALGLGKKVVVLFGPTSASEIEVYGRGEKIIAPIECAGCYRRVCSRKPSCMDLITVDEVFGAVGRMLQT